LRLQLTSIRKVHFAASAPSREQRLDYGGRRVIRCISKVWLFLFVTATLLAARAPDAFAGTNDAEVDTLVTTVLDTDYKDGNYKQALETLEVTKPVCAQRNACSSKVRAKLYVAIGMSLVGLGRTKDAKTIFASALKEDPSSAPPANLTNLAVDKVFAEAKSGGSSGPSSSGPSSSGPSAPTSSSSSIKKPKREYAGQRPARGWRTGEGSFYYNEAYKAEKEREWDDCVTYGRLSYQAEYRTSTQFLVASCESRAGNWLEAIEDYEATAEAAEKSNIRRTVAMARSRADELRAKLPKVTIQKPEGAEDLKVRIGGIEVPSDKLGSEVQVNPGERTVFATGKIKGEEMSFEQKLSLEENETATVEIKLKPKGKAIDKALVKCMQEAVTQDDFDNCVSKNRKLGLNGKFGFEFSGYHDSDKVDVMSPAVFFSFEHPTNGWGFGGSFLVDVVTAASTDIVATASPRWTEQRYVPALGGHKKFGDVDVALRTAFSIEPDYFASSIGASVAFDLRQKTITPSISYDFSYDVAGRADTSYSVFSRRITRHAIDLSSSFVLDKNSVLTTNMSIVAEVGDSSKPYRYIPTFSKDVAPRVLPGLALPTVDQFRNPERILEQLPLSRQRFALAGRYARRFSASTLRAEERLYSDSWGLKATTTDMRFLVDVGKNVRVWPHVRFHAQTGADFWQLAYVAERTGTGLQVPALRSGDRELGPLFAVTGGAGARFAFGESKNWGFTLNGDVIYTQFLNTLYILQRFGYFGAIGLEVDVE
jgi:tetratricopeptide (TPR) repeat protein